MAEAEGHNGTGTDEWWVVRRRVLNTKHVPGSTAFEAIVDDEPLADGVEVPERQRERTCELEAPELLRITGVGVLGGGVAQRRAQRHCT